MTIRQLSLTHAEFIAHAVAKQMMDSQNEPIPPFSTRHPGKLESCLAEPFQTFDGKFLHQTFIERAAVLFYLITKNHCFENGNKRMAVMLTMTFFFINKRWVNIPTKTLYEIACKVAESQPKQRDAIHATLVETFKKYQAQMPDVPSPETRLKRPDRS